MFAYCLNNPVTGYDPTGEWDWASIGSGISHLATGLAAVAAGALVIIAGAPVAMTAVAAVTIGAGMLATANGCASIQQGVTGNNFVRDTVFHGNQHAYDIYAGVVDTAAAIGTAICTTHFQTKCTMKGAVPGTEGTTTLHPGQQLDRYGSSYGRYLTDPGTSADALALTPGNTGKLTSYVVKKPLTLSTGVVAACEWGGGGGFQYFSWMSVNRLVQFGYLAPI